MEKLTEYLSKRIEHTEKRIVATKDNHGEKPEQTHNYSGGHQLGYWEGMSDAYHNILELTKEISNDNKVALMQYENLRKHFRQLTEDVLGEGYWNMGMDVYECDKLTCEHLRKTLKRGWFK